MKIGIDARMMGQGYGIGRYIEQLVQNLQKIDTQNQYVFFISHKSQPEAGQPLADKANFKYVTADIPWYSFAEQIKFSKIIKKEKVDLMHFPHWNIPFFYNDPFVVTIHDLIMFHFPRPEATTLGPIKFWIKDMAHRIIIKRAVKQANHIITTSEFTKQDLHKTLQVPMNKMTTVYQAPFLTINNEQLAMNKQDILDKYGITKPYALCVGSAYPHKNLTGLLKAWDIFTNKYSGNYQLVLVGKESYFYEKLKQQFHNLTIKQKLDVIFTGFVPDDELSVLYTEAKLYIFPSFYEGFGLPPLEAILRGVPVISSNSSCLPEVLGEGAIYFDPNNINNMADTIKTALENENIRHQLLVNGRQELQKYSLSKMTRETMNIYDVNCG